jgi:hypothetical protein
MTPLEFVRAARVPHSLEPQTFGLWTIERHITQPCEAVTACFDDYTILRRWSTRSLHLPAGEVVMLDTMQELVSHMPIWLAARGRVLITGLGLGCVVRGLLANPEIEHVDVVEIDEAIIRVIGPEFAGNERLTLHHGDATTIELPGRHWDFAWHDLWVDDGCLQLVHAHLLKRFHGRTGRQGAWKMPRWFRRRLPELL